MSTDRSRPRSALLFCLGLFALSLPFSIAIAESALALAALAWAAAGAPLPRHAALVPAGLFAATSLVSALACSAPGSALLDARDLLLLGILVMVPSVDAGGRRWLADLFLGAAGLSALWGLLAYAQSPGGLLYRARGPYGHYMAYSGVLMLALILCLARLAGRGRRRHGAAVAAFPIAAALAVTYARNAWLGAIAGGTVTCLVARRRALPAALAFGLAAAALAPPALGSRLLSSFDLETNRDRIAFAREGFEIIRSAPFLGVGPGQVRTILASHGSSHSHVHDTPLQITAERGIPGLVTWLWLLLAIAFATARGARTDSTALAGLGAVCALFVAGLFEYNFGDSEVEMTFLLLASLAIAPRPVHGEPPRPQSAGPPSP